MLGIFYAWILSLIVKFDTINVVKLFYNGLLNKPFISIGENHD